MAISQIISHWIFGNEPTLNQLLGWLVYGVIFGIGTQIYSDYKTRKVKPNAIEKDFSVRQKQATFLLFDYDEAFDLCLKSVETLRKGKVKVADKKLGLIRAKTGISWSSYGKTIELNLKPTTENLTEIEIFTRPALRTVLVDNGKGLETIKALTDFFDSKNEEVNCKLFEAKQSIPINIVSLSQKDEVKNP